MTQRYCEACGSLFDADMVTDAVSGKKYLCPACVKKQAPQPGAPEAEGESMMEKGGGLKTDAGALDEKLTFRCPGCGALLSSHKVEKRSRLTCPKCNKKVVIHPDGTAELTAPPPPQPVAKEAQAPRQPLPDQDLEKLLEFGETQSMDQVVTPPAIPPEQEKAPASTKLSGPQYISEEDEERMKFLDEVQGPGSRRPGSMPGTLDLEVPPSRKKVPTTRRKLGRLATVGQKHETVEERIEASKRRRAASRNKVLAVIFFLLPLIVGGIVYYSASKPRKEGKEESAIAGFIKEIGSTVRNSALVLNERTLGQEVVERPQEPEVEEGTGEKPGEQKKPAEQEPDEGEQQPAEAPGEESGEVEEPPALPEEVPDEVPPEEGSDIPEEPQETPEELAPPEVPSEESVPVKEPASPEKKVEIIKCPDCGTPMRKTGPKCPWCGWANPSAPEKNE